MPERVCVHETTCRFLPLLIELLNHTDVDVRTCAGENIAFLYQHVPGLAYSAQHWTLVQKILDMSKESSKKKTKQDRKTQRMAFRNVYQTLAVCSIPSSKFHLLEAVCLVEWRVS